MRGGFYLYDPRFSEGAKNLDAAGCSSPFWTSMFPYIHDYRLHRLLA